jgi:Cu+-exporting ATPase
VGERPLQLGSARLMHELGAELGALEAQSAAHQAEGRTVSWLAQVEPGGNAHVLGMLAFGDAIKPGAAQAIAQLKQLGLRTLMVSGDTLACARAVGQQLGIDEVHAEVLPGDKAALVESLKTQGAVAMVGDGINDAPALAAADVGIAMAGHSDGSGGGTDVAMQAAGITLLRGDLALVARAIAISRRTHSKIRQNLFWAFAYNVVGIPLAAAGLLNPVVAGAAMAMSSVSVIGNALLLGRAIRNGKQGTR